MLFLIAALSLGNVTEYNNYLNQFNKTYNSSEYWSHYNNFVRNIDKISRHNSENHTWTMGINNFTDLSFHEFKNIYLKSRMLNHSYPSTTHISHKRHNKSSVDWRKKGLVTPVKDQGQCGSCWAFSAVGSLEGAHAKKTGKLVSLSEQNLVDCAYNFGNEGCSGGWMNEALEYVEYNHGIDTEESYPYTAQDGTCMFNKTNVGATVSNVINITKGNSSELLIALENVGPISVAIDAEEDFQMYKSGVYTSTSCSTEALDHGVLAVGYGATQNGTKYYIVKNSWGISWGDEGYVYWNRDIDNMCGIAEAASYPIV